MKLDDLEIPLKELKRFSSRVILKFEKAGIKTVKDLIFYFPYKYNDLTKITKIKDVKFNQNVLISGKLTNLKSFLSPKNKVFIIQGVISDDSGSLKIIWFNQPFILKSLKDKKEINVFGKLTKSSFGIYFQPLKIIPSDKKEKFFIGRIIPVYKELSGLKSSYFEKIIKNFLDEYKIENLEDPLPAKIIFDNQYPSLGKALREIHQPKNFESLQRAKERLSFEQIFYIQLAILSEKYSLQNFKAPIILKNDDWIKEFMSQFNFDFTLGQKMVLDEIFEDLSKGFPMNRLLQGETGAGKTLIAEIISLHFVLNNYQVVFMAPTEILAQQHFQRFLQHFSYLDIGLGLITSGQVYYGYKGFKVAKSIYEVSKFLAQGKISILIGTHSLIENELPFLKVGLVIIDEQQRFGVLQRQKLLENTRQEFLPHFLSMTATPIPRTLALALYGDLSFSYLEEKPFGQKEIKTFVILNKEKEKIMWKFCLKELKEGHQIFVICPRIEEKENDEIASVKKEYEKVKKIFPQFNTSYLHGKMTSYEKESILKKLQKNEIQILVSSSVVEVGIDLPLATVIIIRSPENFGLSQLYQLRGRVGRSIHQGYCFLVPQKLTKTSLLRLKYFIQAKSALELSEYDLKIRGAGEFLGEKQSGIPDLAMKSITNYELTKKAKILAEETIKNLNNFPYLKKEVLKIKKILFSLA